MKQYTQAEQIEIQKKYVAEQPKDVGLAEDKYLIQSMRSTRYSSEAHALADLCDNSIEAGATRVEIIYKTDERNRVEEIAIADNGCGMIPDMLRHAVRWGGSTRFGSRNLFGRFGFGLPSAALKHGTCYSVFSRIDGVDQFHSVTVDFADIEKLDGRVKAPEPKRDELPEWVKKALSGSSKFPFNDVKTVVVLMKRDSALKWRDLKKSVSNTLDHFGVTYSSFLSQCSIAINGKLVESVDPLFITPTAKYYKLLNDGIETSATDHSIPAIQVRDRNGNSHDVKLRISLLDKQAWEADVNLDGEIVGQKRLQIKKNYNGILVYRNGRFIELYKWNEYSWQNYTRQVGVALDFPAELDELFGITPDKQTVIFSDLIEEKLLHDSGLKQIIRRLESQVGEERRRNLEAANIFDPNTPRPSERVAAKLDEIQTRPSKSNETKKEAETNRKRRIKEQSALTGLPENVIEDQFDREDAVRLRVPYRIEFFEGRSGEPFFEPRPEGSLFIIKINTSHSFYTEFYSRLIGRDPFAQSGVELLLTLMGRAEVDAIGEKRAYYIEARNKLSNDLGQGMHMLPAELTASQSETNIDELLSRSIEE